mgnify:CR=1 FL=1
MDQITFSEAEYQTKKRKTRREIFLERRAGTDGPLIRCLPCCGFTACSCSIT